jgi:phenylalanyl-tRNA synthetase beta chain
VRVNIAELRHRPAGAPHSGAIDAHAARSATCPPVVEDLAFVVSEEITLRQTRGRRSAPPGGELLVDLELFDLYRGEKLPAGAKSLAFRLTYQSQTSNLRDSDVAKLRERIVRRVERELGGRLRG